MKHTIVALFSALLFLAFTPTKAHADDWDRRHHRYHHGYDYERHHGYGYYHEGHHRTVYHRGYYAWVHHHRVWVPARTVVVYF